MALSATSPEHDKTYASATTRQKRILFSEILDNVSTTPIWKRGTSEFSAFFDLSSHSISPSLFKSTARKAIPNKNSLGMKMHQEGTRVLAEIFFTSQAVCVHHCQQGIQFEKSTIFGFPSLPSSDPVIRVKLSHLPFLPEAQLSEGLYDLLAPFGVVLEGGIFVDHGWYDGTGYAIICRPSSFSEIPELTHIMSWNEDSVVYATWSSMSLHCSFCHESNHTYFDCPVLSTIRCSSCHFTGHIHAHCPKKVTKAKPAGGPAHPSSKSPKSKNANKSTAPAPVTTGTLSAPTATKRSPPSSDSETNKSKPVHHPPLKQARPNSATRMDPDDRRNTSTLPPSHSPTPPSSLELTLQNTVP
ncbi:hypothetical protein EDC96DRAFT_529226 [Choanephora cucurbitarum]|nr:hypothetical protein EDC96DRAFT_529226 [Choanephora cucurbitarum]